MKLSGQIHPMAEFTLGESDWDRVRLKPDGTQWRTEGEVKGSGVPRGGLGCSTPPPEIPKISMSKKNRRLDFLL